MVRSRSLLASMVNEVVHGDFGFLQGVESDIQ
jgi:hypothetical protein